MQCQTNVAVVLVHNGVERGVFYNQCVSTLFLKVFFWGGGGEGPINGKGIGTGGS